MQFCYKNGNACQIMQWKPHREVLVACSYGKLYYVKKSVFKSFTDNIIYNISAFIKYLYLVFLGALVKLKRLLASSCLSVRPHGMTRLQLDGFL